MNDEIIKGVYVYDIETIAGVFTLIALNIETEEVKKFVIHTSRDDSTQLYDFLMYEVKALIGYNNVNFDWPIMQYFLENYYSWLLNKNTIDLPGFIVEQMYNKAQEVIENQNSQYRDWDKILKEKDFLIPQLDLFRVWHYDNKAKSTSLKALEIGMNFHNVMDMPIEHDTLFILPNQIDEILDYNLNDVLATYEFYKKTVEYGKTDLRKKIKQRYNLPCTNWNNGKIGEQLILKLYCDKTGKNPWEVRKLRSDFDSIRLIDCIPQGINFETKEFNVVLKAFQEKTVDKSNFEKGADKNKKKNRVASVFYKGSKIDYGLGGVHGVMKSGVYESCDKKIIKTADVASLYPWIPIVYEFYIRHLGPEFLEVYRDSIVNVRLQEKLKPKDQQDKAIIDGFKEAANIPYG